MWVRDMKQASSLLLDCIATFTATELFPYTTFVLYVVVTSMLAADRTTLRNKVHVDQSAWTASVISMLMLLWVITFSTWFVVE